MKTQFPPIPRRWMPTTDFCQSVLLHMVQGTIAMSAFWAMSSVVDLLLPSEGLLKQVVSLIEDAVLVYLLLIRAVGVGLDLRTQTWLSRAGRRRLAMNRHPDVRSPHGPRSRKTSRRGTRRVGQVQERGENGGPNGTRTRAAALKDRKERFFGALIGIRMHSPRFAKLNAGAGSHGFRAGLHGERGSDGF